MGECVFLRKPLLAVPLEGQFEQVFNARYLTHLGYGAMARETDAETLSAFLADVPRYQDALSGFSHDGNAGLMEALDQHLDQAAAGLL